VASNADAGAVIDADGERITLVDDTGRVLSDDEALVVLLGLVLGEKSGADGEPPTIVLPVSARAAAAGLCRVAGAELVETGLARADMLAAAREPGVIMAAGGDGSYVFPRFLPAVDAVATLVTALTLLASSGSRLSELVSAVVPSGLAQVEVAVPFSRTGQVMRTLLGDQPAGSVVTADGLKVAYADGWALVAPDPDRPRLRVMAEAGSDGDARTRAEEYASRVRTALGTARRP
jgi:mannose-1-phosphate guanylyltransferase/phosphomannomutase